MIRCLMHLICCTALVSLASGESGFSEEDSNSVFFSDIENTILKDYQLCTGDSAIPSRKALLKWKSENNFITESANYPELLKKFAQETGINPADVRPCEIVNWSSQQLREKRDAAAILEKSRKMIASRRADSIYVLNQLAIYPSKPFHFYQIPFGVSKKAFKLLSEEKGLNLIDKESHYIADSIAAGSQIVKGAFHFDKNGLFDKYEIESRTGSLDSLDWWIRPLADSIADFIQQKIGIPPDHTYRIGRFDITQGRLAIYKLWNLPEAAIYVGLATYNYRYYAKLIVSSRGNLNKMKKDTVQQVKKNKS